jgi:ubiquinone/menaquinone biosynthesis C-methylase UbiE
MQPDQDVVNRWSKSAQFWEKHREVIRGMFEPVTRALIQDAEISSGQTILDIATGPGEPALSLAGVVGPAGKVCGVDPISGMIEAARRAASSSGVNNVQFEVAFADQLPFPAGIFDAVVSRFGAMFFPAPGDAAREILRVLKPGRKFALAVWHAADKNPFHYALSRVVDRHSPSPPPEPDVLDAFRFAVPGKLESFLKEAGATNVSERLLRFDIQAPISAEEFWAIRMEMSDSLREKIAALSSEQFTAVTRELLESVRKYSIGRGVSFPAEVLMVSGTKAPQE